MDGKIFKKPAIAFGRKVPLANKENKERSTAFPAAVAAAQVSTPRKHNCVTSGPSKTLSVSLDDVKATAPKETKPHGIDLADWEARAKRAVSEFCAVNGIDVNVFFPDDAKKKVVALKAAPPATGRPVVVNANKLLPTFKAMDTLLMENNFPPQNLLEMLKPLGDTFFVKRCAYYWNVYAKAAMMTGQYELAVDLLDRGTKFGAEPLTMMLRAYNVISRRLATVISERKGDQKTKDQGQQENQGPLQEISHQEGIEAIQPPDLDEHQDVTENTETEEGVESEKTTVDGAMSQGDIQQDMPVLVGEQDIDAPIDQAIEERQINIDQSDDHGRQDEAIDQSGDQAIVAVTATLEKSAINDDGPVDNGDERDRSAVEGDGDRSMGSDQRSEDGRRSSGYRSGRRSGYDHGSGNRSGVDQAGDHRLANDHGSSRQSGIDQGTDRRASCDDASNRRSVNHGTTRRSADNGSARRSINTSGHEGGRRLSSTSIRNDRSDAGAMDQSNDISADRSGAADQSLNASGTMDEKDIDHQDNKENQIDEGAAADHADQADDHDDDQAIDQVPELPTASAKTPRTTGRHRIEVDPNAIFKSSATKLLVMENKPAKKPKAGTEHLPAYHVTPVRRSTRKTGGYDKWLSYRDTVVDTPGDFSRFDGKKTTYVKNPYLKDDDDDEYESD